MIHDFEFLKRNGFLDSSDLIPDFLRKIRAAVQRLEDLETSIRQDLEGIKEIEDARTDIDELNREAREIAEQDGKDPELTEETLDGLSTDDWIEGYKKNIEISFHKIEVGIVQLGGLLHKILDVGPLDSDASEN